MVAGQLGAIAAILVSIFGWLALRFIKRIDEIENNSKDHAKALDSHGDTILDLKRTVRALYKRAYPQAVPPISDD